MHTYCTYFFIRKCVYISGLKYTYANFFWQGQNMLAIWLYVSILNFVALLKIMALLYIYKYCFKIP